MAKLSIGEAEELLRLPASTLRHWEKVLAVVAPDKDAFGRRVYGEAELRLLFRIRHLSQRMGLGLKEAEERVLSEIGAPHIEARMLLAELRGDFVGLWSASREAAKKLEAASPRRPETEKDQPWTRS
ncbi:MAG TPA: MerR family transcriptional regulator [Rectinemataceae bacterium]|nr:MerR family transcriptional regulator [Rectinemataceae bacterium]